MKIGMANWLDWCIVSWDSISIKEWLERVRFVKWQKNRKWQNWKVSKLESVRIGNCQNLEIVRIGNCQNVGTDIDVTRGPLKRHHFQSDTFQPEMLETLSNLTNFLNFLVYCFWQFPSQFLSLLTLSNSDTSKFLRYPILVFSDSDTFQLCSKKAKNTFWHFPIMTLSNLSDHLHSLSLRRLRHISGFSAQDENRNAILSLN